MTTPDAPASAPLEVERTRLRKAGYTDAEVSQILVARELAGSQQAAGAAGHGVMSSVLSSIVAVASHVRALIPTFRRDVETVFDGTATASARAAATASLVVKAVVVVVLGYAAWQEWRQHIIYATETAANNAALTAAQSATANTLARPIINPTTAPEPKTPDLLTRLRAIETASQICKTPADPTANTAATHECELREAGRLEHSAAFQKQIHEEVVKSLTTP